MGRTREAEDAEQIQVQASIEAERRLDLRRRKEEAAQLFHEARHRGFEAMNEAHIKIFRQSEEATQLFNQARFEIENAAHIRRLQEADVVHEIARSPCVESGIAGTNLNSSLLESNFGGEGPSEIVAYNFAIDIQMAE